MGSRVCRNRQDLPAEVVGGIEAAAAGVSHSDNLFVAYSGGVDSHVLLHLLSSKRDKLSFHVTALHVDHRLQPRSEEWAAHCLKVCRELDVPCRRIVIEESIGPGDSPEAWAREVRYRALTQCIGCDDILVTAHHRDDQAETFLLNAFRGSGPRGLAAMPLIRKLEPGWLLRPMLSVSRASIESYARDKDLTWIDDLTNSDARFDRNFIRHSIMPLLESRWGNVCKVLSRVAQLQTVVADELDTLADEILASAGRADPARLPITVLQELGPELVRLVIRRWIKTAGFPVPDLKHIDRIEKCVLGARPDAQAAVLWKGAAMRRYRGQLYVMHKLAPVAHGFSSLWDPGEALQLVWGELAATSTIGEGLSAGALERAEITVQLRRGGERCHPSGRQHSQTLKRLFQEWGIPPWERDRTPLVFVDGKLAAVGSTCVCHPFAAQPGETAWKISWRPCS